MKIQKKNYKIRNSAKGEECTLQIEGVCNYNQETTVWCHSNKLEHGKGMGTKANDVYGCYGCSSCHDVLDGRAKRPAWMNKNMLDATFDAAREKSMAILRVRRIIAT